MYREEQGLLYHKIQEGIEEGDVKTPLQESEREDERFYTMCLIFDPEKAQTLKVDKNINKAEASKMVYFEESDITANSLEYNLAGWVFEFNAKIAEKYCVRRPRFSELRPAYLKSF